MDENQYNQIPESDLAAQFRKQLDCLTDEQQEAVREVEAVTYQTDMADGLPDVHTATMKVTTLIKTAKDALDKTRVDSWKRDAELLMTKAKLDALRVSLLKPDEEGASTDLEPLRNLSAEVSTAELDDLDTVKKAVENAKEEFFGGVRAASRSFWDTLIEYKLSMEGKESTIPEHVRKFEDVLIRWGWPLEFDAESKWTEAAQRFVPGLDRLISRTRTANRRKGLLVLQHTLKDTEFGIYDGVATAHDLELMNERRRVAGHALAWLLEQPCPPARPTDALRREIELALSVLATSPMGDPKDRYVDDFEEGVLISSVPSAHQAPPDDNPGVADPRLVKLLGPSRDAPLSAEALQSLLQQFGVPPMQYGVPPIRAGHGPGWNAV